MKKTGWLLALAITVLALFSAAPPAPASVSVLTHVVADGPVPPPNW